MFNGSIKILLNCVPTIKLYELLVLYSNKHTSLIEKSIKHLLPLFTNTIKIYINFLHPGWCYFITTCTQLYEQNSEVTVLQQESMRNDKELSGIDEY